MQIKKYSHFDPQLGILSGNSHHTKICRLEHFDSQFIYGKLSPASSHYLNICKHTVTVACQTANVK